MPPDAARRGPGHADSVPHRLRRRGRFYAGCGKVGMEVDRGSQAVFQLSQRADFFSVEERGNMLHNRPLVNTRDEPHATPRKYRRLHVIVDAMRKWDAQEVRASSAAAREVGSRVCIANPVQALKTISRDQSLRWLVTLEDGTTASAVDVQRMYLQEALCRLAGSSADVDWALAGAAAGAGRPRPRHHARARPRGLGRQAPPA